MLDEPLPLPDGTQIELTIKRVTKEGSVPTAWIELRVIEGTAETR